MKTFREMNRIGLEFLRGQQNFYSGKVTKM